MGDDGLARGGPVAEHHVDHASGQPGLRHDGAQHPGRHTCHLAAVLLSHAQLRTEWCLVSAPGFADHGVAGHDGGGDLEGEEVERQVPGGDEPRHAQRPPAGQVHHARGALARVDQALGNVYCSAAGYKKTTSPARRVRTCGSCKLPGGCPCCAPG